MGRPQKKIDMRQLEALCQIQCTDEEIGAVLGVSSEWIRRRKKNAAFLDVMTAGRDKGKASLRRKQYEAAMGGNTTMLVWLGKNLLGQSDKTQDTLYQFDVSNLTNEQLKRLAAGEPLANILASAAIVAASSES